MTIKRYMTLSIHQPYASLIVAPDDCPDEWVRLDGGPKRVENRDWPTKVRGWILIHATKSTTCLQQPREDDCEDDRIVAEAHAALPRGCVVGAARLVECARIDDIRNGIHHAKFPWLKHHYHVNGDYCFVFDAVRQCPIPFAVRGKQGFFWTEIPKIEGTT